MSVSAAIRETNFELPGQVGAPYHGKVGDVYTIKHSEGDLLAVVRTDRISAFDVVLPEPVPTKGQVLNQLSAELLEATRGVVPNWLIESPDPNVTIGHKAEPFKIEMIMRGYLLGSSWKAYNSNGVREICGNAIPDGMSEFEPFKSVLLTPTTKAEQGHDENINPEEIIASGLATKAEYDAMSEMAYDLFDKGQVMARERGLILADTKYEFGRLATKQVIVIDEVHTPDSSRYFPRDQYEDYLAGKTTDRPEQLSKEFVREWLISQGFTGDAGQEVPSLPDEFITRVANRYQDLYQRMLGRNFEPVTAESEEERLVIMQDKIDKSLMSL